MNKFYYQKVLIWCLIQAISSYVVCFIWIKDRNISFYISINDFVVVISLYSLYEYYWDLYFYPPPEKCIDII